MKTKYLILIGVLILVAGGFETLVFFSPLGEYARLENAIQSAGIFVALLAAVMALSVADPKRRSVNVKIEPSVDEANIGMYSKNELSEDLKRAYQNFSDPVKSYRVQFKLTNISGFTLEKPTLTFRLPLQKQHPHKIGKFYSEHTFNSNLFNSQRELRLLEFGDTRILSNSNLPYWNDQDDITIWIRMVLDDGKLEPFVVEISVNCENADGVTDKVEINPKELMK
jgi:hypothetical protein